MIKHVVTPLKLPVHRVSVEEYRTARAEVASLTEGFSDATTASRELFAQFVSETRATEQVQAHGPFDNKALDFVQLENAQAVIRRYETQDEAPTFCMELHALRLGACAFVTNPFELFLSTARVRWTYYKETENILGNTFGMCVLQVGTH